MMTKVERGDWTVGSAGNLGRSALPQYHTHQGLAYPCCMLLSYTPSHTQKSKVNTLTQGSSPSQRENIIIIDPASSHPISTQSSLCQSLNPLNCTKKIQRTFYLFILPTQISSPAWERTDSCLQRWLKQHMRLKESSRSTVSKRRLSMTRRGQVELSTSSTPMPLPNKKLLLSER